jgi:hypothetical protein
MDSTKVYWRDTLVKWLGWGSGVLAVFAGWAVEKAHLFEIGPWADGKAERGSELLGASLLAFTAFFSVGWMAGARWICRTHLSEGIDGTVLPWKYVRFYVHLVVGLLWTVASLVALL